MAGRAKVVEQHTGEDSAEFASGRTDTVGESTDARWEKFSGDDKGGGVGTEVEKHLDMLSASNVPGSCGMTGAYLSNGEADELSSGSQMSIVPGNDGKHERADEEALNLDPATTEYLDEVNREEVPGDVAGRSDDEIPIGVLEKGVIFGLAFGETNRREKDRLIEIQAVESDIDQEPAGCGTNELLKMSPFAKVDHECLQLHVFGWWRHVCFDDGCMSIGRGKIVGV